MSVGEEILDVFEGCEHESAMKRCERHWLQIKHDAFVRKITSNHCKRRAMQRQNSKLGKERKLQLKL